MQDLANTAWAFATASQQDARLFAALERLAELHLGDFSVQELANTAWAFATASQQDAQLFAVLTRVPPFSVAWLASTCSKNPRPSFFGHIFQSFFKIGFFGFGTSFREACGTKICMFFDIFPYYFWASFLDRIFIDFLLIFDPSNP